MKWGILGCGGIAGKFCDSMRSVPDGEVAACASRTPGKAAAFAETYGIGVHCEGYEALLAMDEVDAVYVATTHNFHHDNVIQALRAGKHVVCEKPLSVSRKEAESMAARARERGLFLMEGMWTRFLPAILQTKRWLREGRIGEVRMFRADFCIQKDFDPNHRLFNPELAGGALWDTGIYPVAMASMVMNGEQPQEVRALADVGETGVDEAMAMVFRYAGGVTGLLSCAGRTPSDNRVEICGSEGRIVIPRNFLGTDRVELHRTGAEVEVFEETFAGKEGFRFEILAAQAAIRKGEGDCAEMTVEESVAVAETMDRIRAVAMG